ncbi:protein-disulfide reductase DsbD domain-containing protein [uncultured Aureimonas sp.]|uniref:protein-disulfide reductase DsbD domain-containing protein n=1 Tax=uncultured Aureimonas sp. TaxID=1604662 RepID=UPI0025E975D1|nr:protein-disulfide reductase DsbD domain-containing protein [uncultured Aureimonas sp.]
MSRRFCTSVPFEGPGRLAIVVTGALLGASLMFGPANAADRDRYRQEGVTLRLVALPPEADGTIRGALSIELEPGWKTYWIAPGPVGLAPQLDTSGSTDVRKVRFAYPVPSRFREGEAESIGYLQTVELPITAEASGPRPLLRLRAFLGVCRELCVPVQAELMADPNPGLSDRAMVMRAGAVVPDEAGPLRASGARWNADGSALLVDLASPIEGPPPEGFVSAGDGWSFGAPSPAEGGPAETLVFPALSRPTGGAHPVSADILLTQNERAQLSRAVPIAPR